MAKQRMVEVAVGAFIALGIGALVMLALKVSNVSTFADDAGYPVVAHFENIGGLKERAPVTMAGVRVGRVSDVTFDEDRYQAKVTMQISGRYDKVPVDTTASIFTAGVLGENYVGLEPGAEDQYLTAGDEITLTQSAMILERLIGEFLFQQASGGGNP